MYKIDRWLHQQQILLLFLLLVLVLRIPNFFEPYWYGDEAIYLTIGQGIRDGERLYADIVDHKTPLIYYLAAVPNQLTFRVLNLFWMLVTTIAFSALAKKLLKSQLAYLVAMTIFVIFTTVPWFEGNIPNGELFVMGFVLTGAWLLSGTDLFSFFLKQRAIHLKLSQQLNQQLKLVGAGILFGLAILTKVPAIFDVAGLALIAWFGLTNYYLGQKRDSRPDLTALKQVIQGGLLVGLGLILPVLVSIVYFVAIGAGKEYLEFGLLYNFRYANNWQLPFSQPWLQKLFTLPGKLALLTVVMVWLTAQKQRVSPVMQLVAGWFMLSLVGSLLSNRPYPHYFQQIVPALALLLAVLITTVASELPKVTTKVVELVTGLAVLSCFVGALLLLQFAPYSTFQYYRSFFKLITGLQSTTQYQQSFNNYIQDNYQAAEIIKEAGVNEIFIWGTNPLLYAVSNTQPTGRFTVSFHIKDFDAYTETMLSVEEKQPLFIVTMNDETTELPGLNQYLTNYYLPNSNFEHFTLWKRVPEQMRRLL